MPDPVVTDARHRHFYFEASNLGAVYSRQIRSSRS